MGYISWTSNLGIKLRHGTKDEIEIIKGIIEVYTGIIKWDPRHKEFVPYEENGKQYECVELMQALAPHLKIGSYIELTGEDGYISRVYLGRNTSGERAVYNVQPNIQWPKNNEELLEWK